MVLPVVARASKILPAWYQYLGPQKSLLQKIVDRIRNSLELKVVLQTTVDEIATNLNLDNCIFLWYFEDTRRVQVVCEHLGDNDKTSLVGYHPIETFSTISAAIAAGELIVNSKPMVSHQISVGLIGQVLSRFTLNWYESGLTPSLLGYKANLLIPVKRQEGWVGYIACLAKQTRYWWRREVELVRYIAQPLEIAIRQAQLYEQTQKQAQRERLVNQITSQTRQSFDLEIILTEAIAHLREAMDADRCLVHLVENFCYLPEVTERGCDDELNRTDTNSPVSITSSGASFRRKHLYEVCRETFGPSIDDFDTHGPITEWVLDHRQPAIITDITQDERIGISNQEYQKAQIKSSLVVPVIYDGTLCAIVYLNQCSQIRYWSKNDQKLAQAVADCLAISIQQAKLYSQTQYQAAQSAAQAKQMAQTLLELREAQAQLIQSEKMSGLGQMVAGVAHEINNPINFIYGNIPFLEKYVHDLIRVLQAYQGIYPSPSLELQNLVEEVELDFILRDIPPIFKSMQAGAERIQEIVQSLQSFSRLNEAPLKTVNLQAALESTLSIVRSRHGSEIQIVRQFGELPLVECYPKQINQVFLSILMNAIEALSRWQAQDKIVTIRTQKISVGETGESWVRIAIADNGPGIPEEIQPKIFDPFFTTKEVGQGRGLGLAVSYQTIISQHQGRLHCSSSTGQGAEFVIEIPVKHPNSLSSQSSLYLTATKTA